MLPAGLRLDGPAVRGRLRLLEDQRENSDYDQQSNDEDDANRAAKKLEHVALLW